MSRQLLNAPASGAGAAAVKGGNLLKRCIAA
jgi:hypothetical protein